MTVPAVPDPLDGLNVTTLPRERIPEVRAQLVVAAGDLLTRSTGEHLAATDAERFEQVTKAVNFLDLRARMEHPPVHPLSAALESTSTSAASFSSRGPVGSIGEAITRDERWQGWAATSGSTGHFSVQLERRAIDDLTMAAGSAGSMVPTPRLPGIHNTVVDRPVALLDLLPRIQVTHGDAEIVRDVTPDADLIDRPKEVPERGLKPDAGLTFEVSSEPTKTVAVMAHMTRQAAADVPMLASYLDGRLRYALRRKVDAQLINGTGASGTIKGILAQAGINTYAPDGAEARYRSIRHAITMMEEDEVTPEIVLLNPRDAEYFDLSNDTSAGLHAADADGGITSAGPRTAWGLRQVRTNAIPSGTAVLLDPTHMAILDRQALTAYSTDAHGTNFAYNVISVLLECRVGLAVFIPSAICRVVFNGTT